MAATSQKFIEKLIEIGYPEAEQLDASNIDFLFHNKRLEPFLSWICNDISAANIIPPDELNRYNELVESGAKILEVEELGPIDTNFHKVLADQITEEEHAEEIKLKLEKYSTRKRLNANLKQSLTARQSAVSEEISEAESSLSAAQRQLEQAIIECECANTKMNAAQQTMNVLLRKAFDALRPSMSPSSNAWFFSLDFKPFWRNIEESAQDVLTRMQRKFSVRNVEQIRSLEKSKQWLKILRGRQAKCELTLYQTESEYEGLKAELATARKILDAMDSNSWKAHSSSDIGMERLKKLEAENVAFFQAQILPKVSEKCDLIYRCTAATQYPAELKRIAQSTAMLQTAISQLLNVKGRVGFVSVAFTIEQEFFTGIRTFMHDLNENLQTEVQWFNARKLTVTDLCSKLPRPSSGCQRAVSSLVKILGINDSRALPAEKLTAIKKELAKMEEDKTTLREALDSKLNQEVSLFKEMDHSLNLLTGFMWRDCATLTVLPPLTPPTIDQALHEISDNLDKGMAQFLEAINEEQNKKVLLDAASSKELRLKRKLYSYFYVDPDSFRFAIEALGYNKTTKPSES